MMKFTFSSRGLALSGAALAAALLLASMGAGPANAGSSCGGCDGGGGGKPSKPSHDVTYNKNYNSNYNKNYNANYNSNKNVNNNTNTNTNTNTNNVNVQVNVNASAQATATATAMANANAAADSASQAMDRGSAIAVGNGSGGGFGGGGGGGFFAAAAPVTPMGSLNVIVRAKYVAKPVKGICVSAKGLEEAARLSSPVSEVTPGQDVELFHCVAGDMLVATIGRLAGADGKTPDYVGGYVIECRPGEALHHGSNGMLACVPQRAPSMTRIPQQTRMAYAEVLIRKSERHDQVSSNDGGGGFFTGGVGY